MKKRNKKSLQEKDFLRLQRESAKNYETQRNLGYVELDEPIHNGYRASLCLRHDVANREDAWIFQGMIDCYGTTCFAKKVKDLDFSKPTFTKHTKYSSYLVYHKPHIEEISEYEYNTLVPQAKKWFSKRPAISVWRGDTYKSIVPSFFFDIQIEKNFITKMRIFDEILEQEEAEIDAEIERNHYTRNHAWYKAPKGFRKALNRTQRAKAKQVLQKIISTGEDLVFEDNYKGADWLYW
jgi:hypothetical protein